MSGVTFPTAEKRIVHELSGKPGFYEKITGAEAKNRPDAIQAFYGSGLSWFVPIEEAKQEKL